MAQIDPREVEAVRIGPGGRPLGLDLVALESTRFGLEVLGLGYLLLLVSGPLPLHLPGLARIVGLLPAAGFALLTWGVAAMAPTPNGPIPRRLRAPLAGVFALGLAWALAVALDAESAARLTLRPAVSKLLLVPQAAPLALAWVLWRFCQHRGLIGRALTWLWIALAWTLFLAAARGFGAVWAVRFYPALGVAALVAARASARDVWIDAVTRRTERVEPASAES